MASLPLRLIYRPLVAGWCLKRGDFDSLRNAISQSLLCWGGIYHPLIVVDDLDNASYLVNRFCPDFLVEGSTETAAFVERFPHLDILSGEDRQILTGESLSVLDVMHAVHQFESQRAPRDDDQIVLPDWSESDELSDVFLVSLGRFGSNPVGLQYQQELISRGIAKTFTISPGDVIWSDLFLRRTPARITDLFLSPRTMPRRELSVFLGRADDFDDLVTFWNLRASGARAVFSDPTHEARLKHAVERVCVAHQDSVTDRHAWPLRLVSRHTDMLSISDEVFQPASRVLHVFDAASDLQPARMQICDAEVLGALHRREKKSRVAFSLLKKPADAGVFGQRMAVTIGTRSSQNEETSFRPLPIPELNRFYGRQAYPAAHDSVRCDRYGISLLLDSSAETVDIGGIKVEAMVAGMFSLYGLEVRSSHAGLVAKQMRAQMGRGNQGARVFKIPGVRALLRDYAATQSFRRQTALKTIGKGLDKTLFIEQRDTPELTSLQVFQYLLRRQVILAGLEPQCPNCQLKFWIPFYRLRTRNRCEFCAATVETDNLLELGWSYRRSGLFAHGEHQSGAVPVLLAMQHMETAIAHSFGQHLILPSMTFKDSAVDKAVESDIVCAIHGVNQRIQIVIGECKTSMQIDGNDIRNLLFIADRLPRELFDVYLLVAKSDAPFTEAEIAIVQKANPQREVSFILWAQEDLEPYSVFARARATKSFAAHGPPLEALAAASRTIYLS